MTLTACRRLVRYFFTRLLSWDFLLFFFWHDIVLRKKNREGYAPSFITFSTWPIAKTVNTDHMPEGAGAHFSTANIFFSWFCILLFGRKSLWESSHKNDGVLLHIFTENIWNSSPWKIFLFSFTYFLNYLVSSVHQSSHMVICFLYFSLHCSVELLTMSQIWYSQLVLRSFHMSS